MANTRRNRGHNWETRLLKHYTQDRSGYIGRILGGSTTGLPDLVITHNGRGLIMAIEAKATTMNRRIVPQDQIERCIKITEMFGYYPNKRIMFAFKFIRKGLKKKEDRTEGNEYEKREGKTFFIRFIDDTILNLLMVDQISCRYDGKVVVRMKEKFKEEKPPYFAKIYKFDNLF